jgi:hypothetical protein
VVVRGDDRPQNCSKCCAPDQIAAESSALVSALPAERHQPGAGVSSVSLREPG